MPKATAFAPPLIAFLLGCSALSNTAQAGWFDSDSKPPAQVAKKDDRPAPPPAVTLDDSIREAQMLRLAGNYQEAINHLSQLMLVAADDARIISEYGKTLVSMGRADEAEKFLSRAEQLQPDDWSLYSALGVAYDEIGNQKEAQVNYERALTLRPGESSVLNNYALSRMLAKDPAMARKLADRAETANTARDEKIARNIAMIRSMAPEADQGVATNTPAPGTIVPPVTAPQPHVAITSAPLAPVNAVAQAPQGVVMQRVPVDPLAGTVGSKETASATRDPRSLQPNRPPRSEITAESEAKSDTVVKTVAKPDVAKPAAAKPAQPAIAQAKPAAPAVAQAKADAGKSQQAKSEPAKPPAVAQAKPAAGKDQQARKEPAKPVLPAVSLAVKAADVKPFAPQAATKVLPATPGKAADAKPQDVKSATAKPASKDAIPGLRMSANAY